MTGEPTTTTETVTAVAQDTQPVQNGAAPTFTQPDVDRIVGERLKREREVLQSKFLADLGVKDADALKGIIEAHNKSEEAKRTEVENWQKKYADLEAMFATVKGENEGYKAGETKRKRNDAILNGLRDAKASDVDDLLVILEGKYADDVKAVLSEDGTVDKKAIEKLVTTAKAKHEKYFTPQSPGSLSNRNGNVVNPTDKARQSALEKIAASIRL